MINDQEKQSLNHFKGKYQDYNVQLDLFPDDQSVEINIKNIQTLECFEAYIDFNYFQLHKEISYIFEAPSQIMKYITHHFEEIIVTKNGEIRFEINISVTMKPKLITLTTMQKSVDKYEMINLKIQQMKESFEQKQNQNKLQMQEIRERNSFLMEQIAALKKEVELSKRIRSNTGHPQNPHNHHFSTRVVGNSMIISRNGENAFYHYYFQTK